MAPDPCPSPSATPESGDAEAHQRRLIHRTHGAGARIRLLCEAATAGTRLFGFEADAACISPTTGLPLFEDGKATSVVNDAIAFCEACQAELNESSAFGAALARTRLLEPQSATIELKGGGKVNIDGFRTVDRNRLAAVHDEVLLAWRSRNWLLPLYAHLFSAANWVPFTELATSQLAARQ